MPVARGMAKTAPRPHIASHEIMGSSLATHVMHPNRTVIRSKFYCALTEFSAEFLVFFGRGRRKTGGRGDGADSCAKTRLDPWRNPVRSTP
jgi:hypothetical protein